MVRGRRAGLLLLLLTWALALGGCAPVSRAEQPANTQAVPLSGGQVVGQSLKASYAGLQGVELYLNPQADPPLAGMLYLHLKASPEGPDLARVEYPLAQVTAPGYYRFSFPPQPASSQADFYIMIELDGSGQVAIGSAPGDAYLNGSAYAGSDPIDGQLAFQLTYDPIRLAGGLLFEGLSWLVLLFGMGFLLVLPGWALLNGVLPEWSHLGWPEKTVLSAGVALALYPVLFLWAHLIGFAPGAAWAWAPGLLAGGFLFWRNWRRGGGKRAAGSLGRLALRSFSGADFWPNLVFAVIALVIFGVRFWVIRGIDVPLWGDSYQHTVIAQLMLDSGGLFDSWEPYAPYQSLTVQYGFPVLSALWAWLSGQDILKATLAAGQVANGLAVLALYPLALLLARGNHTDHA